MWGSYGKTQEENMFCGGMIYIDQASMLIHVEHQVSLGTMDMLIAKWAFEWMAIHHGVTIWNYHGDNGAAFTSCEFNQHILDMSKGLHIVG